MLGDRGSLEVRDASVDPLTEAPRGIGGVKGGRMEESTTKEGDKRPRTRVWMVVVTFFSSLVIFLLTRMIFAV